MSKFLDQSGLQKYHNLLTNNIAIDSSNINIGDYQSTIGTNNINGQYVFPILAVNTDHYIVYKGVVDSTIENISSKGLNTIEVGDRINVRANWNRQDWAQVTNVENTTSTLAQFEECFYSNENGWINPYMKGPADGNININISKVYVDNMFTGPSDLVIDITRDFISIVDKPLNGYVPRTCNSLVTGLSNSAYDSYAIIGGYNNLGGKYSLVAGNSNRVGYQGMAFGQGNKVYGLKAVAIGQDNSIANNIDIGFASGKYNVVNHTRGQTIGTGLITGKNEQIVLGKYNAVTDADVVIGVGTSDATRKNGLRITSDGRVYNASLILYSGIADNELASGYTLRNLVGTKITPLANTVDELKSTVSKLDGLAELTKTSSGYSAYVLYGSSDAPGNLVQTPQLKVISSAGTANALAQYTSSKGLKVGKDVAFSAYENLELVPKKAIASYVSSQIAESTYELPKASSSVLGGVTTTSSVTSSAGYTACPIISGIPYFKNTTYTSAGTSLGLVKSGGDVTISSGVITVNDDSHNHTISNIDGLQAILDSTEANINETSSTIQTQLTSRLEIIQEGAFTYASKMDVYANHLIKYKSGTNYIVEGYFVGYDNNTERQGTSAGETIELVSIPYAFRSGSSSDYALVIQSTSRDNVFKISYTTGATSGVVHRDIYSNSEHKQFGFTYAYYKSVYPIN